MMGINVEGASSTEVGKHKSGQTLYIFKGSDFVPSLEHLNVFCSKQPVR